MRSILNGILLSTITMTFATWFLSSAILKTIQKDNSSSSISSESITNKIQNDKDNIPYVKSSSSTSSYKKTSKRTYYRGRKTQFKKTSNPFGAKLNLRANPNPFDPKLSLRGRRSPEWGRKCKSKTLQQQKQYQQTNTQVNSNNKSSSQIVSGYQNYIDILNEQMKD